jgi:hypothetical protein
MIDARLDTATPSANGLPRERRSFDLSERRRDVASNVHERVVRQAEDHSFRLKSECRNLYGGGDLAICPRVTTAIEAAAECVETNQQRVCGHAFAMWLCDLVQGPSLARGDRASAGR